MTTIKLLSAGLIAAAMLASPAMARENQVTRHHVAMEASAKTAPAERYVDGRSCIREPRVGAFATDPWTAATVPCEPQSY
jgi:hypothetical protein